MKVLIIEDEAPAARRLQLLLKDVDSSLEIIATTDSIISSVQWLNTNPAPDLIFMDIQLADGLSFEIFSRTTIQAPVIFTTAYDEYSLQAFKANGIDYLLKPVEISALAESIQKLNTLKEQFTRQTERKNLESLLKTLRPEQPTYKSRFLVKIGDRLIFIPSTEIAYFMAEEKIVLIITMDNKKYIADHSLDELEPMMNPKDFFRLNRQFLAHIQSIKNINQYFNGKLKLTLQPSPVQEVLVSRERASTFKRWLDV
ncbi:response regulator transcription factor [Rhodocytophaga rosea]|uniref:Response regulator transcription factor n=1 Tax=Rhodocytophaga rosea TaxID=2704465 RepID=A0A6C0GMD2_9BACT|nr:LytTR family DNA-binding domain-containing protein [Rhodocytophaga rosea]QHT69185.1 response regulator transcription factor [Rhodocytophaga rosea]